MRRLIALLVLPAIACAGGDASRSALEANRLALEPELRIGSIDDPDASFSWFRGLEVASDGRIYTAHPQETVIRVHDADGRPLDTIGGKGEGPGEFDRVGSMGMVGDTLWVLDHGLYRFSFFGLDGELIRTARVPIDLSERGQTIAPPRPNGLLSDGTVYGAPPAFSRLIAAGEITELPILRMTFEGDVVDTIAVRSYENTTWAIQAGGFGSYRSQPFGDTELVRVAHHAPEVVHVERAAAESATRDTFRVTKVTLAGDTVFSRGYDYSPVPVDLETIDSLIAAIGEAFENPRFSSAPTPARAMEIARETLYLPAFQPPVTGLVLGRDGTVWLKREQRGGDTADWSVLAPDGDPIGTVAAPSGLRVMAADRWTVRGMETDELDVPYIVRYAVVPADGSDAVVSPQEIGG